MPDAKPALAAYLCRVSQAQAAEITRFSRLGGGAIQDNFALDVTLHGGTHPGTHQWVVRSDAPSRIESSLTRAQEFHILQCVHQAGVLAPQPLWRCDDPTVLGQAFFIMQRAAGTASPKAIFQGLTPDTARTLTHRLGQVLARLHTLRPPQAALSFLPVPDISPAQARLRTYQTALGRIHQPHPVLEWALLWLAKHTPKNQTVALCHGDFRTGNYLVADGALSAILDWEFTAWSDPHEDLGWLCCKSWRFGAPQNEVGGIGHKVDLFAGYQSVAGQAIDPDAVRYWEVMGFVRWAIIALQQAQRHLSGQEPSLALALTGRMVPEMEHDLLAQIHEMTHASHGPNS